MATALDGIANLDVLRQTLEPNRAQTLIAEHRVPMDSGAALSIGTAVKYTDTDLGKTFEGKIIDVDKIYDEGEGIRYTCAGPGRRLAKETAKITSEGELTAKIKFDQGTDLHDAIDAVLSEIPGSVFPGGIDKGGLTNPEIPGLDKGGQKIITWLDDLLDTTSGGIWFTDLSGSPQLRFENFYSQPAVTLLEGTFNVVATNPGDLLIERGRAGKSINRKVKTVYVQGAGKFLRHNFEYVQGYLIEQDENVFRYKWYVPDNKRVTCKFINIFAGTCEEQCMIRLRVGGLGGFQLDIENPPMGIDAQGNRFWFLDIVMAGASIGPFPSPQVEAWFTYTTFEESYLFSKTSAAPELADEGDFWEFQEQFFSYDDPLQGIIEFDTEMQALTNALFDRHSGVDFQGDLSLHINGLNANLQLGCTVTNFTSPDARVRSITYDFIRRSTIVGMSNTPIRDDLRRIKQAIKDGTLEDNNWYVSKSKAGAASLAGCFQDIGTAADQNGSPQPTGPDADEEEGGKSWSCQFGVCVELDDDTGQFGTQDECVRVCGTMKRYTCVDFNGCIQVEDGNAPYDTLAECETDCDFADDPNAEFNCDPVQGCVAAAQGVFPNLASCTAVCFEAGSGPGGSGGIGGSGVGSGIGGSAPTSGSGPGTNNLIDLCCFPGSGGSPNPDNSLVECVIVDQHGHVAGVFCRDLAAASEEVEVVADVCWDPSTCEIKTKKRTLKVIGSGTLGSPQAISSCS